MYCVGFIWFLYFGFTQLSLILPTENLYTTLDVTENATLKEIRRAFKTLAVKLHPDKNQDDANADEKFSKILNAYEILKDPEARKRYDLYGDTGDTNNIKNKGYQAYTYYRDQFGIYDDDPLIVTLSRSDYEINILDDTQAWFVNFYSPQCHHCHELAPIWRKLAQNLEGVIRFGAVNCEDDWSLCYQLSIAAFPTLMYYEKEANLHEGFRYKGLRTHDDLHTFVLSMLRPDISEISETNWNNNVKNESWILFLTHDDAHGVGFETRLKLATILDGLFSIGTVTNLDLFSELTNNSKASIVMTGSAGLVDISGADYKEILNNVMDQMPSPLKIDEHTFQEIRTKLRSNIDTPWLLCFYLGQATELDLQLKRIPLLYSKVQLGLVHCGRSSALCAALHVHRYPAWGVLKVGGAFELHYGRDVLHEIITFARDSTQATNLHAISPADFHNIQSNDETWLIDWYAPWCPPCKKLLPEIRRSSQRFSSDIVQFGTVDCTSHKSLCVSQSISSYPSILLYHKAKIHRFHGVPSEDSISEFVMDFLNPVVIYLNKQTFFKNVTQKPINELWLIDYFAPWCGPCQRLAPEWRKLAKQFVDFKQIRIAQVDCVENDELCNSNGIKSYPTIRLYPIGSIGLNKQIMYKGNRDATSIKGWLFDFIPTSIIDMSADEFTKNIKTGKITVPWLVDFYAPWCGHCIHFESDYRKLPTHLGNQIQIGKVNCEKERIFCAHNHINSYPTLILFTQNEKHMIGSRDVVGITTEVNNILEALKLQNLHDEL